MRGEDRLYELNARSVHDVAYRRESDVEQIEIVLEDQSRISLRTKPHILLDQSFDG